MKVQRVVYLLGAMLLLVATRGAQAQPRGKAAAQPRGKAEAQPQGGVADKDSAAAPKDSRPSWVRKADKGFFDDPMAVHPELGLLAVIRTDSASFANLELFDLNKKNKVAGYPLGDVQQIFERLEFTGDDQSLVMVVRDGKTGKRTAQRFDKEGKAVGLVGPATDIGLASRGDDRYLVRWDRSENKKGESQFVVSVHNLTNGAPVGKSRVLTQNAQGNLMKPGLKALSWFDGYTRIYGQEAGGYDKSKDMRMPDRLVIYDVLSDDVVWRQDIKDVIAWAAVNQLRGRRAGRSTFTEIAEDQSGLQLIDGAGARVPLALRVPFEMYDLRSLSEQERDGRLRFSLTVDLLNPEALVRKKADVPKLDLYDVALPSPGTLQDSSERRATHLIRTPMDNRPVIWTANGPWLVLLRKFKNFNRGGEVLEVYRLP